VGAADRIEWLSATEFRVGGTAFEATVLTRTESDAQRLCILKHPDLIGLYADLVDDMHPKNVVELGIATGGSTALLAELAQPSKLVAIELSEARVGPLDDLITARGWRERIRPYYGVDQGDRTRVAELLDAEFGDAQLDLVIDDASHDHELTRASFDLLFPRLRQGGAYVIEDWGWAHHGPLESHRPADVPLTVVVFELVLACTSTKDLFSGLRVDPDWTVVRRGSLPLDRESFELAACYGERGRALVPPLRPPRGRHPQYAAYMAEVERRLTAGHDDTASS
jgi:predicted O-methyltransferase YrrM